MAREGEVGGMKTNNFQPLDWPLGHFMLFVWFCCYFFVLWVLIFVDHEKTRT